MISSNQAEQLIRELVDISGQDGSFENCFLNILTLIVQKTDSECGCIFAEFENTDRILSCNDKDKSIFFNNAFSLYQAERHKGSDLATRPHVLVRELESLPARSPDAPEENSVIYPLYDGTNLRGMICLYGSAHNKPATPPRILSEPIVKLIAEIYRTKELSLVRKYYAVETAITELVSQEKSFHRLLSIILESLDLSCVILLTHDEKLSCVDVVMADSSFPAAVKNMIEGLHVNLQTNSVMLVAFRKNARPVVLKPEQIQRVFSSGKATGSFEGVVKAVAELPIGELLLSPSGYRQDGRMLFLVTVKKARQAFMQAEIRSFQQLSRIVSLAFEKRMSDRIRSKRVAGAENLEKIVRRIIDDSDINLEARIIQQELEVHSCMILQLNRLENVLEVEGFSSTRQQLRAVDKLSISLESLSSSGYAQSDLHQFRISKLSEYANLIEKNFSHDGEAVSLLAEYKNYGVIRIPLFDSYRRLQGILLLLKKPDQETQSSEIEIMKDFGSKIANAFEIRQSIYYDSLTGLPNLKRLRSILVDKSISAEQFSLMICKFINLEDIVISRGDEVVDRCITVATRRIKALIKDDKRDVTVFRSSGEASLEVLFPSVDKKELADFSDRLVRSVGMAMEVDGNVVSLQVNVGVCPSTGILETDMIVNYSKLAIQAVSDKRNVFCVFDAPMQVKYLSEKNIEEDIRKSLSTGDFVPYYQPKVSCSGSITGYEALARWKRGSKFENPGVFIDKIEKMGMMQNLFDIVFSNVCKDLKESRRLSSVSINVSPSQLGEEKRLLQSVSLTVSRLSIDPGRITFEFVETALLDSDYYNAIRELKRMGFGVSLDDFGTGYARYKTLVDLFNQGIVNEIKVDKAFIDDIESHANRSFMRSISYLAEEFGITTVAEGVETMAQLSRIRSINPSVIVQGWLVARALPREEVEIFDESGVISRFQRSGT